MEVNAAIHIKLWLAREIRIEMVGEHCILPIHLRHRLGNQVSITILPVLKELVNHFFLRTKLYPGSYKFAYNLCLCKKRSILHRRVKPCDGLSFILRNLDIKIFFFLRMRLSGKLYTCSTYKV